MSPPTDGVYFHPQILALRVKLPLTPFIQNILARFKVPPLQLTPGAWRTVLGFEALCAFFAPEAYGVEELRVTYRMRKTHHSFLGADVTG